MAAYMAAYIEWRFKLYTSDLVLGSRTNDAEDCYFMLHPSCLHDKDTFSQCNSYIRSEAHKRNYKLYAGEVYKTELMLSHAILQPKGATGNSRSYERLAPLE